MAEGKKNKGLGRGLDALFGSSDNMDLPALSDDYVLMQMNIEQIQPGELQPRTELLTSSLQELAASIKAEGVLNPIIVRPLTMGRYEIVAGERRFQAAKLAGLKTVPVIVRELDDKKTLALALIENLQREDLNPIDEALGIQRLIEEFQYTHEEAAQEIGRARTSISNALRLLNLATEVQNMIKAGQIDMGHARALLSLSQADQVMLAKEVVAKGLNVRQVEALCKRLHQPKQNTKVVIKTKDDLILEESLAETLGTSVKLTANKKGKGKIVIEFANLDQLQGIVDKIQG